ncbi:MAG: RnfABCDGE type electron transport complex subunit D [Victivallales bacterium]|jgi:electron transport complex protein RnfD|nr:RnfABCDGE type electron transport complex subunit D [Victivallales bacterium]
MSEVSNQEIKLPVGDRLIISSSPHIKDSDSVRRIMFKVILALLPACAAGIYFFGFRSALVMLFTMAFCVGAEALWCYFAKKPVIGNISDGSAALTGLLLALNLPPQVPYWVCLIGAFLAIWLGKQIFGGIGNNPFNPALVARVGLLIALPAIMTTWQPARGMSVDQENAKLWYSPKTIEELKSGKALDAVSCATPLGVVGTTKKITDKSSAAEDNFAAVSSNEQMFEYFLGRKGGCIGETSVLALLIGGIMLVLFNLINWRVPVIYIGTVALFAGLVNYFFPGVTPPPLFHILTGGLVLGAVFMATDMVTSPITGTGCVVFAFGCGVITTVIRIWGNYPEGVSFSILFMNALVPLIDRYCTVRPFGYVTKRRIRQ